MQQFDLMHWLLSTRGILDLSWLVFLLFIFYHFWKTRSFLQQTENWLITKGRITSVNWTKEGHRIWHKVAYVYQVFDEDFHGEYLFLDTSHNNPNSKYARRVAYKAAMAYENDQEIDVFYNPNNPQQSALDIKIPTKLNLIVFLLILLILLHLGVILMHLINMK